MFEDVNPNALHEKLNEVDESAVLETSTEALGGQGLEMSTEAMAAGSLENAEDDRDDPDVQGAGLDKLDEVKDMEGMMNALQLTDTEKQQFRVIGENVTGVPVETCIKGYKKGACYDRLIPIYS